MSSFPRLLAAATTLVLLTSAAACGGDDCVALPYYANGVFTAIRDWLQQVTDLSGPFQENPPSDPTTAR